MPPDDPPDDIKAALDAALDHVLLARVLAGGINDVVVPDDALGQALVVDRGPYRTALRAHKRAYERLRGAVDPDHVEILIELADAGNQMASASADIGWRLGFTAARGRAP